MRHGLTVVLVALGLGLFGPTRAGKCGEPFEDLLGRRIEPIFLLTRGDVQADLKLLPNQIADLHRVGALLYRKAQSLKGKTGPSVNEARRQIDEELTNWLGTHLTLQQLDRLQEIDFQWEGAAAMVRPIVVEYLQLTADQKQRVAEYLAESTKQRKRAPWTVIDHLALSRKAVSILSDTQQERWASLLGQPCQFLRVAQNQR
jgi:hypothetical protein